MFFPLYFFSLGSKYICFWPNFHLNSNHPRAGRTPRPPPFHHPRTLYRRPTAHPLFSTSRGEQEIAVRPPAAPLILGTCGEPERVLGRGSCPAEYRNDGR